MGQQEVGPEALVGWEQGRLLGLRTQGPCELLPVGLELVAMPVPVGQGASGGTAHVAGGISSTLLPVEVGLGVLRALPEPAHVVQARNGSSLHLAHGLLLKPSGGSTRLATE